MASYLCFILSAGAKMEQIHSKGLFGWAVAVKKVAVGCELWKKLL
jgi:hypothetical protein